MYFDAMHSICKKAKKLILCTQVFNTMQLIFIYYALFFENKKAYCYAFILCTRLFACFAYSYCCLMHC